MDAATVTLPRITDGDGVLIVLNAQSGAAVLLRGDPRPVFAERLPAAVVHELAEGEDLAEVVAARMAGDEPPSVLGAYGGDGTVSRMAGLARRYDVPLLVLPGGTFNHFARALGVDSVDAALGALGDGAGRTVTVADVSVDGDEPITVLNALSVGVYPAFLDKREGPGNPFGKWLGGVIAARRELREAQPIRILHKGRRALAWSLFVSVGRNESGKVATMQRVTVDDGLLDIRIHHARGSRFRAMTSLAFGSRTASVLRTLGLMAPESDVERHVEQEFIFAVRPRPGRPSVFVHDGELEERDPAGFTLACTAVPSALRVYAPQPAAERPSTPVVERGAKRRDETRRTSAQPRVSRAAGSPGSGRRATGRASAT
jgi:diacylglycerol kinase family enzyme